VNPQGSPENHNDVQSPNPIRGETQACLDLARRLIHDAWIPADPYNSLTESFESQRETCRQNMCDLRGSLSEDISRLLTTPIEEMSSEELQEALKYTQEKYQDFRWWRGTRLLRWLWGRLWIETSNTRERLCDIQDKTHANLAQERILNLLYWDWFVSNGYNQEYLHTFNESLWWNAVIAISGFEAQIQNIHPRELNSLALVNYFKYLESQKTITLARVMEKIGATRLMQLGDLWREDSDDKNRQIAKRYFERGGDTFRAILEWARATNISELLQGTREDFKLISELLDATSEDDKAIIRQELQDTLVDVLYNWEWYELLERLAENEDTTTLQDGFYKYAILTARSVLLARDLLTSFGEIYKDNWDQGESRWPEVTYILKALIITTLRWRWIWDTWEIEFNFEGINSIIRDFNSEKRTNYPEVWWEFEDMLINIFTSGNLNTEYLQKLQELTTITNRINEIETELNNNQASQEESIILARKRRERRVSLQRELSSLRFRESQLLWQANHIESQIENLQRNFGHITWVRLYSQANRDWVLWRDSETWIINPDIRNERLIYVSSLVEFKKLLPHIQASDIDISYIDPKFLLDEGVLRFFMRDIRNVNSLPPDVFKAENIDLIQIIFDASPVVWKDLFRNILASNTSREATRIINNFNPWEGHENHQDYISAKPSFLRSPEEKESDYMITEDNFTAHLRLLFKMPQREAITDWRVSPEVPMSTPWGDFDDVHSDNPAQLTVALIDFIHSNWINETILNQIKTTHQELGNTYRSWSFLSWVLPLLNSSSESSLQYAIYFLELPENNQNWMMYYNQLPANMRRNPYVLEVIGKKWIEWFKSNIIHNITDEKSLARYLIWFKWRNESEDFSRLRRSPFYNLLIGKQIEIRTYTDEEVLGLTGEAIQEREVINRFFKRNEDIANIVWQVINRTDMSITINENTRSHIYNILTQVGIAVQIFESIIPENLSSLTWDERRVFLTNIWNLLDREWKDDSEITEILSEIYGALNRAWDKGIKAKETWWLEWISDADINTLRALWFEIESREWGLDETRFFDSVARDYFERYVRANNINPFNDPQAINNYVNSLWIQDWEIRARILASIEARAQSILNHWEQIKFQTWEWDWRSRVDWARANAQESITAEMQRGEYKYAWIKTETKDTIISRSVIENWNPSNPDYRDALREISTELRLTPEETRTLTPFELYRISQSEQIRENFIWFRTTLAGLGLWEIWQFRNEIITAIGSTNINQNDTDYLNREEINKFIAKTVYATTWDVRLKDAPQNFDTTQAIIRDVNNQWNLLTDVNAVNSVGKALTQVEFDFREKFAPRNNWIISFNLEAFKDAI